MTSTNLASHHYFNPVIWKICLSYKKEHDPIPSSLSSSNPSRIVSFSLPLVDELLAERMVAGYLTVALLSNFWVPLLQRSHGHGGGDDGDQHPLMASGSTQP